MSSRHSYKSLGTNPDQSRGRTCRRRPRRCVSEFLRTVRSNPADGPPLAHPNHQKHRRKLFSSPLNGGRSAVHFQIPLRNGVFLEPNLPLYGGRSAVQYRTVRSTFFDNYTEPNLFWTPSRILPANGPGLKGGRPAVTVAL